LINIQYPCGWFAPARDDFGAAIVDSGCGTISHPLLIQPFIFLIRFVDDMQSGGAAFGTVCYQHLGQDRNRALDVSKITAVQSFL